MALDDLSSLKSIAVPTWLKLTIGLILTSAVIADTWIASLAMTNVSRKEWFPASVQLFGSLVPIIVVVLLLALSRGGVDTLRKRTTDILIHVIPASIPYAATGHPAFETLPQMKRNRRFKGDTEVQIAYYPGDFYGRYRILFPDTWSGSSTHTRRECFLIVDLKVRQANMHLCVEADLLEKFCRDSTKPFVDRFEGFRAAFPHTLNGAEVAGCTVNKAVADIALGQQLLACVIVVRPLSAEFLHDASEQLYVTQDLVAMLRSFWRERPDWFPIVSQAPTGLVNPLLGAQAAS